MAVSTADPAHYQATFDRLVRILVPTAASRSRGFAERLQRAGLEVDDVNDVAALDLLPVLSKDELLELQRRRPPFGELLAADAQVRRIFQSPGPLYEPELAGADGWRWMPALQDAGFGLGDRVLISFAFHLSPAGAMFEAACLELGAAVLPAGVGNKDAQLRACVDLGITAYIGTPSYLKALLDAAEVGGVRVEFDRAFVTGEPLPNSLRQDLERRVGVVRQGYGTAETGNLGYECEAKAGLHVSSDALVQVCDITTGAAVDDDSDGQLVVTLFSTAYPIVRFGTGDLSRWLLSPCGCEQSTPRIAGLRGRIGDAIKVKGMFLHPAQVAEIVGAVEGVKNYRTVIDRHNHVDSISVELEPLPGVSLDPNDVAAKIRGGLRFSADVSVVEGLGSEEPKFQDLRTWD